MRISNTGALGVRKYRHELQGVDAHALVDRLSCGVKQSQTLMPISNLARQIIQHRRRQSQAPERSLNRIAALFLKNTFSDEWILVVQASRTSL